MNNMGHLSLFDLVCESEKKDEIPREKPMLALLYHSAALLPRRKCLVGPVYTLAWCPSLPLTRRNQAAQRGLTPESYLQVKEVPRWHFAWA